VNEPTLPPRNNRNPDVTSDLKLLEGFTGGDPEIQKGLNKMWADQTNWPDATRRSYAIKPEIQAFIIKAMQAEK